MVRTRQDDQGRPARRIMGPQSALTDFLASRNISARQIEADFLARREAAAQQLRNEEQQQQEQDNLGGYGVPRSATTRSASAQTAANESSPVVPSNGSPNGGGLTAQQKTALAKIKAAKMKGAKGKGKGKGKRKKMDSDDEDDTSEDDLAALLQNFNTPLPGQMENCAQCGKRFTVTPYSRADASGKLLCTPCGRELDKDKDGSAQKAKKKAKPAANGGPVGQRRKQQSRILDGASPVGAKPLVTLCVEHLSKNIHLADDLGDLPEDVINRIARMLAKRRLINPKTVDLFVRPDAQEICVYDCAMLAENDFLKMLQAMPDLKRLTLYNAIQFKDPVMDYLLQRDRVRLDTLCLYGANLLTDTKWKQYLVEKGKHLQTLQICHTDKHITDEVLQYVKDCAPNLTRLKIRGNQQLSGAGVDHISRLERLQHLNLRLTKPVHADVFIRLLLRIGGQLQTLSLREVGAGVDNAVLMQIHQSCRQLRKLRITESEACTDDGFARLFEGWANPPLHVVDLEKNRYDDADQPRDNADQVGLCSGGFKALMAHSGAELQHLNIYACRHIERQAFEEVFSETKRYPELRRIEASFCEEVTDHVVSCMFRSCPQLREVVTFGCMRVTGTQVPHGRVVVGVPNALGMQTVGSEE